MRVLPGRQSDQGEGTVRLKFSVYDNANCGIIVVIASMTIVELFGEYPTPFSSEMIMIVIDHDTS